MVAARPASTADQPSFPGQGLSMAAQAPFCSAQGFTGETNTSASTEVLLPYRRRGRQSCSRRAAPAGRFRTAQPQSLVGDTHLATFHGLYDFQASGDFVLAEVDPNFVVQARQVSGAPKWPNASVNSAIATQMDKTQVAVCLTPPEAEMPVRLFIDGNPPLSVTANRLSRTDGADVTRVGNVYVIRDQRQFSPCHSQGRLDRAA